MAVREAWEFGWTIGAPLCAVKELARLFLRIEHFECFPVNYTWVFASKRLLQRGEMWLSKAEALKIGPLAWENFLQGPPTPPTPPKTNANST